MHFYSLTAEQISVLVTIGAQGYTVAGVLPQEHPEDAITVRFWHPQRDEVVADIAFDGMVYPDYER